VLADSRDRDVGRSLLSKITANSPRSLAIKRRILALSDRDRRTAHLACLDVWPRNLDRQLIDLLEKRERSVDSIIRRTRAESWRQRRRAIDILDALGQKYDPVRLHDLRRRVRSLRYAIEVLAEVDTGAQARVAQLKPLQSVLGDIQDRTVLSDWLRRTAGQFRRSEPALAQALRREADRFRHQSMLSHARFLRLGPKRALERLALHVDASSDFPHAAKRKVGKAASKPGPRAVGKRRTARDS
jgi:CHAD domain-containing protein